jgi:hypothetical protein
MKEIWIIGAGRFGHKAISAMKNHHPGSVITVVDHSPQACEAITEPGLTVVCMDGVTFLNHHLTRELSGWIIPVIPVHLAYEWVRMRLMPDLAVIPVDIPENIRESLPNAFPGKPGEVFVSNAAFVCPDNCAEPLNICTYTRLPRKQSLYQAISKLSCRGFTNLVLRSWQLAPGIGGISPEELFIVLEAVQRAGASTLLSTACRCHGVVQAFRTVTAEN